MLFVAAIVLLTQGLGNGVITGRLLSIDGTPAAGVRIAAIDASRTTEGRGRSSTMMSFAQTDSAGRYRVENLPPGRYYVLAGAIESPSYYPGSVTLADALVLTVAPPTPTAAMDFVFVRPGGAVRIVRTASKNSGRFFGAITDPAGIPLPNTTLILVSAETRQRFMTSTNATGAFEFSDLPIGPLSMEVLSVVQTGYRFQGYEQIRTVIQLQPRQILQQDMRLRMILSPADQRPDLYVAPPARQPRSPSAPTRMGMGTGPLRTVPEKLLAYPQNVTDGKIEDEVILQALVGTDGKVLSLRVFLPDTNPDLARAAVEEVQHWVFSVPRLGATGEPVEQHGLIAVKFARNN